MALERKPINGTTPQDIANMNHNMEAMWFKLFGNLNLGDVDQEFIDKLNTEYVTVQGEGNVDSAHPLYIRFFIPPDVKKLVQAPINIMLSRYRMDSGVAEGGGAVRNLDIAISTETASVNVQASVNDAYTEAFPVMEWGGQLSGGAWAIAPAPNDWFGVNMPYGSTGLHMIELSSGGLSGAAAPIHTHQDGTPYADLFMFQHTHKIKIPGHSHPIAVEPHGHTGIARLDIPDHIHPLEEKIKESVTVPTGISIEVNGTVVKSGLSGDGTTVNDINILDRLNIGGWNIIRITSQNVARVTVYGIIELINQFKYKKR